MYEYILVCVRACVCVVLCSSQSPSSCRPASGSCRRLCQNVPHGQGLGTNGEKGMTAGFDVEKKPRTSRCSKQRGYTDRSLSRYHSHGRVQRKPSKKQPPGRSKLRPPSQPPSLLVCLFRLTCEGPPLPPSHPLLLSVCLLCLPLSSVSRSCTAKVTASFACCGLGARCLTGPQTRPPQGKPPEPKLTCVALCVCA